MTIRIQMGRRHITRLCAVLLLCGAIGLHASDFSAQTIDFADYERVLIPVMYDSISGSFGSLWKSTFVVYNGGETPAAAFPAGCFLDPQDTTPCSATFSLPPRSGSEPIRRRFPGDPPGLFFYVKKDAAAAVHFNLRAQDLSRLAETLGTEIPVIRERDLIAQTTELVNVPITAGFRDTLRVYDFDATGDGAVTVTAFDLSGVLQGSLDLRLVTPTHFVSMFDPGYAEISSLAAAFPSAKNAVVLEIKPTTPGLRYWAFVSVTNNVTQDVTTVTPH